MAGKEIVFEIKRPETLFVLSFLFVVFFLELQVTFFNPIAFGDEGYHVNLARWMGTNIEYPVNTPLFGSASQPERFTRLPFWNILEASFYMILGFNEVIIKFLMPFISFLTGLSIYLLVKKIYSKELAVLAAIISVTIPSFVTYAVLFYTTVPFVFFASLSFFSFLVAVKTEVKKYWILTGIFSGLALLSNIASLVLVVLFILYGFFELVSKKQYVKTIKLYSILLLLTFILVAPWVVRNVVYYKLPNCNDIVTVILGGCAEKSDYVSKYQFAGRTAEVGTETGLIRFGISNYLLFAYGNIWFVPLTFLAGLIVLLKRRENSDIAILILLIIFAGLFIRTGGIFSGRTEDTARYFLFTAPVFSLISSIYLALILQFLQRYHKILIIAFIFIIAFFSYDNFKSKLDTMSQVKGFSPLFLEACDNIKSNLPKDAIILSLHTYPTIYNCERQAVWEIREKGDVLLSNDLNVTLNALRKNGINYIFVQKFSLSGTAYGQSYPIDFVRFLDNNKKAFEKIYENGPALGVCITQGGCDGSIVYRVNF